MRSILSLAIGLLLVVALLWRTDGFSSRGDSARPGNTRKGLHLIAAAQGHLLPRAFLGSGPERLGSILLVGALSLPRPSADPGLRVAVVESDGEVVEHRNYNVAHVAVDAREFTELPSLHPVGTLLVIASTARIQPSNDVDAASKVRLQSAVESLGARSRPFERTPLSWALISLRRPEGWVMLAEGLGYESGVVMAFTLAADHSLYDYSRTGFRGDYLFQRGEDVISVQLYDEVVSSAKKTARVKAQPGPGRTPGDPSQIRMPMRARPVLAKKNISRIAWEGLWLGIQPNFRCRLGLRPDPKAGSVGAIFKLLIDGEVVGEREIAGETAALALWTDWEVDLAAHAERVVELEIQLAPNVLSSRGLALFDLPTVSYARSF